MPRLRHLVACARNALVRREVPVWYSPAYRLPLTSIEASVGMSTRRADDVAWWLLETCAIHPSWLRTPHRVSYGDLDRVHSRALLESLTHPETLAHIFGVDASDIPVDEVIRTVRLACGGTLAAAREALARKSPTLNLQGGFHHAGPHFGGGFCPVNDVAVAIAALRADGFTGRVIVLDLDAHPPDGLAACLAADPAAWIGSLSGSDWGPLPGVDETLLREERGDDAYLAALASLLGRMPSAALAFVLAGGDVLRGDRFGRLGLTLFGARQRDREVSQHLEGLPSVWLPAGGYHPDAWRVLAGTAMTLAIRWSTAIPACYDPLAARFAGISAALHPSDLGETRFSAEDLEEALGPSPPHRPRLLLGYYTAAGIEHALYRYGLLDQLRRIGYGGFRIAFDRTGLGERLQLFGKGRGEASSPEHLLIELVLEPKVIAARQVLFVHWLSLRHPRAHFNARRPRLPGQEVPGLGLAKEIGELLAIMARRLDLAGVVFRPAHYHTAFTAGHAFSFIDARRQGRFEALTRALAPYSLLEATSAVAEGRVLLGGAHYGWEADEMALWLDPGPAPGRDEAIERERGACHFTVSSLPPGASAPQPASRGP